MRFALVWIYLVFTMSAAPASASVSGAAQVIISVCFRYYSSCLRISYVIRESWSSAPRFVLEDDHSHLGVRSRQLGCDALCLSSWSVRVATSFR